MAKVTLATGALANLVSLGKIILGHFFPGKYFRLPTIIGLTCQANCLDEEWSLRQLLTTLSTHMLEKLEILEPRHFKVYIQSDVIKNDISYGYNVKEERGPHYLTYTLFSLDRYFFFFWMKIQHVDS